MEEALGWLGKIFDAIISFFPHCTVLPKRKIALRHGPTGEVKVIKPKRSSGGGFIVWWPLIHLLEEVVIARQVLEIPPGDPITSNDGITYAVGGVLVYEVIDPIVYAVDNEDADAAIAPIAGRAFRNAIALSNKEQILDMDIEEVDQDLTKELKDLLEETFGIKVQAAYLTTKAPASAHVLLGCGKNNSAILPLIDDE